VRLACERHLADLAKGHERGLWFDPKAADIAFRFFGLLRLSKGRWANPTFTLQPWQQFFIGSLFGWKRADGFRRFREGHLEVARKNGKTETAAAIALKLLCADGEEGGEVYCLATKRDQAKTTFDVAKKMAGSQALKKHLRRLKAEVRHEQSGSKLEPLGSDADTLDSLNVHGAIKDELHAWKSRELWDVMDTATGARMQPLALSTTTAGHNRRSIWWERRELCLKLLEGVPGFENDELFPLIYTPDDGDDVEDPAVWVKGNPSLGVIVRREELAQRLREAKQSPKGMAAFIRLRMNKPTETATRWMPMGRWRRCAEPISEEELIGRPCWGGLDLSMTTDLTAWGLVFPPTPLDPKYRLLVRHFLPRDEIEEREKRDKVPYRSWADGVRLTLGEGNWVDYGLVRKTVLADGEKFRLLGLAFDRKFAPSLVQTLMADGIECVPWSQGTYGMTTATKEMYRMVLAGELRHQGCPLLTWEVENTAIKTDPGDGQMPDKAASSQRIDGVVAGIMALGLAIHKQNDMPAEAGVMEMDLELW
jgi:phage terminase large subunit-like protein